MKLRVTIICAGRFHLFDLARELNKLGVLQELHTAYPKFFAVRMGIPSHSVKSYWWHEILWRIDRYCRKFVTYPSLEFIFHKLYSLNVRLFIAKRADIYVVLSSFMEPLYSKLKSESSLVFLERGSTHIGYQDKILRRLSNRYNTNVPCACPRIIAQELREYHLADFIFVPTEFGKKTFELEGVNPKKLRVNAYGVEFKLFTKGEPCEIPAVFTEKKPLKLIFIGALSERKGIFDLLRWWIASPLKINLTLTLVGSTTLNFKKEFGSFDLRKAGIEVVGVVPQAKLACYVRDSHLLVLPSHEEGLALVQLQALAMGRPIIGTDASGIEELDPAGEFSWVITPGDMTEFEATVMSILTDPTLLRNKTEAANRSELEHTLSWSEYARRALTVYTEEWRRFDSNN